MIYGRHAQDRERFQMDERFRERRAAERAEEAKEMDDKQFGVWLRRVDKTLGKACGLGIDDFADQPYRDMFDDGATPEEVAVWALEGEGL